MFERRIGEASIFPHKRVGGVEHPAIVEAIIAVVGRENMSGVLVKKQERIGQIKLQIAFKGKANNDVAGLGAESDGRSAIAEAQRIRHRPIVASSGYHRPNPADRGADSELV